MARLVGRKIVKVRRERQPADASYEPGKNLIKSIVLDDGTILYAFGWEDDAGSDAEFVVIPKPPKTPTSGS
jgi:hypothetical protein